MSIVAHQPGSHALADQVRLCRRCGYPLGDAGTKARKSVSKNLCRDCFHYHYKRRQEEFAKCPACDRWTLVDLPECIHCEAPKEKS